MGRLSAADRKRLPSSRFAGPGRTFPLPDAAHDRAAIRDAPISQHAGNITAAQAKHITQEARADLRRRAGSADKVAPRRAR